jgi:hypothetical protein
MLGSCAWACAPNISWPPCATPPPPIPPWLIVNGPQPNLVGQASTAEGQVRVGWHIWLVVGQSCVGHPSHDWQIWWADGQLNFVWHSHAAVGMQAIPKVRHCGLVVVTGQISDGGIGLSGWACAFAAKASAPPMAARPGAGRPPPPTCGSGQANVLMGAVIVRQGGRIVIGHVQGKRDRIGGQCKKGIVCGGQVMVLGQPNANV